MPVRPSSFVPLDARHRRFNVEVDLRQIGAYGVGGRSRRRGLPLLYADLQEDTGTGRLQRLGSGRAGIYRGKYLKGVGRTLLAGNWNDPADADYGTGHLMASGGIREFIVSLYLDARGCGTIAHGVEGILMRRIVPPLRAETWDIVEQLSRAERREGGWQADCALQAMTIKTAGFVRYANIIWLLNRNDFSPESPLRADQFFALLDRALDPDRRPPRQLATPADIVAALRRSIERGIDHFRRAWLAGVTWWSVHNNFSMDGRFIDLETPVIVGRPLVGIVAEQPQTRCLAPGRAASTGLFEVLEYLRSTRNAIRHIGGRLTMLSHNRAIRGGAREYLSEVVRELRAVEKAGDAPFSSDLMGERLWTWAQPYADGGASRKLRRAIRACSAALLDERRGALAELRVRSYSLRLARLDLGWRPVAHLLEGASMPDAPDERAAAVNGWIDRLERLADVDRMLDELASARAAIKRLYAH